MTELSGLRVLVIEDEGPVALLIETMLEDLGCKVVASVSTFSDGLNAATADGYDVAVLDVNVAGRQVFPIAEILQRREIPFLFSTGYGQTGVPDTFHGYQVLSKPFTIRDLERKLVLVSRKVRRSGH